MRIKILIHNKEIMGLQVVKALPDEYSSRVIFATHKGRANYGYGYHFAKNISAKFAHNNLCTRCQMLRKKIHFCGKHQ